MKHGYDLTKLEEKKSKANKTYYYSRFDFLKVHNGIRPECLHGLIGTSGAGKSTLFKTIICDSARFNDVLILLSEESRDKYMMDFPSIKVMGESKDNLHFIEEKKIRKKIKTLEEYYSIIETSIFESGAKFLFIDNITTSMLYSERAGIYGQQKSADFLSELPERIDVSVFYMAHTKKEVKNNSNNLMTPEDIRGLSQIAIQSEYFYTMQKFTIGNTQANVITVHKHRFHKIEKRYFLLMYQEGNYVGDADISIHEIKQIHGKRDRLGK